MIPAAFDYHSPRSLDEALSLLKQHAGDAKILAGGQSLIPAMRFRLAMPAILIDINRLNDLRYVEERGDHLAIGAMTREHALEDSSVVRRSYPLLHDTAVVIADPLVRNQATVGGNIAHADPANDHPATMLAYNATAVAKGPKGERTIPIDDFFTGLFENAMADDEILIEIRIPKPAANSGGAYTKLERKVGDYAISAAAVQLRLDGDKVAEARIGLTNVSAVPMRAKAAEAELVGKSISDAVVEAAGKAAAAECDPSPDLRGGVDYKRDITRVMVKRSIQRAVARAKGGK
ncbi:MAG: xanthine dehydrogenase family protein subunit M [Myxococcales bacterium]|nr:xanthine dehydrogenase family protein subunit M [Myxococcales bacterium]MDH3483688.1 xanthine dehydrogenase family protein subunit M [Myxococcales bacterium]